LTDTCGCAQQESHDLARVLAKITPGTTVDGVPEFGREREEGEGHDCGEGEGFAEEDEVLEFGGDEGLNVAGDEGAGVAGAGLSEVGDFGSYGSVNEDAA
jgi:hypothetical protein